MDYKVIKCIKCNGRGRNIERWHNANFFNHFVEEKDKGPCDRCNGLGVIKVRLDDIKE